MNLLIDISQFNAVIFSSGIIVLGIIVYLWYRLFVSEKKRKVFENRYENLEGKINSLQLKSLESKLNPHLLRNILNATQSHAYLTFYSLEKLDIILDYILFESRKKYVTPEDEIDFALNLIEINKIKISPLFELKVKKKINESEPLYKQKLLAPLISIDLIENAFKHADIQKPDAFINITFEFTDNTFFLTVKNKISTRPRITKKHSGIGLKTLEDRLNIIYKDCFNLKWFIDGDVYISQLKINLLDQKSKILAAKH